MSGHGANPIFQIQRLDFDVQKTRYPRDRLRPITSHFCLNPPRPPSNWTSYVYHPLYECKLRNDAIVLLISSNTEAETNDLRRCLPDLTYVKKT